MKAKVYLTKEELRAISSKIINSTSDEILDDNTKVITQAWGKIFNAIKELS
tara:strand:- start:2166 stop:2318 length:153 start_codon:yes stop_codon:yes gene_type:complete